VAIECDRWEWQSIFASKYGPPDPSTRLVLFVLLMHLYKGSKSAFPSQERIAELSGLSSKSVRRHLEAATERGWLKRQKNQRRGKVGIWYQYFPTIPKRLRKHISRMDTVSHRENERPDSVSHRPDNLSLTTGQNNGLDRTPCPPNQGLNQVLKQGLNHGESAEPTRSVVNDIWRNRTGIVGAEAAALAHDTGFRDPLKGERAKDYMHLAKLHRDYPKVENVEAVKKLRRKVSMVNGEMRTVVVS
jgi:hypothetical protein